MRDPRGVKRVERILSEEARLAVTPFRCGRCLPCKIVKRKEWILRILMEHQTYNGEVTFLTLTYDQDSLPKNNSLEKKQATDFIKRIRYYTEKELGSPIRHFTVGEYGDCTQRPHYHSMLFGINYLDSEDLIKKAWKKGFSQVGECNEASARYIAGYTIKKMTNPKDNRLNGRSPEFMTSSRGTVKNKNGGLGKRYIEWLAEEIKKQGHYDGKPIYSIRWQGKEWNLGRYLTQKLNKKLGVDEKELWKRFAKFQDEVYDTHIGSKEGYYNSIVNEKKQARLNQKKRLKLKKGRTL